MARMPAATKATNVANKSEKAVKPAETDFADATTDHTRWRLLDEAGRHTWHYLADDEDAKEWPQTTADRYHLGLPTVSRKQLN